MSTCPTNRLTGNEVEKWLQYLKLSQYAPQFHHNRLTTLTQCISLDRQTLELMGIALPGHVTRLERAIVTLRLDLKKISKSSEDLRAELYGGHPAPSRSAQISSETTSGSINRSESYPEIYGAYRDLIPSCSSSSCGQIDYFDLLSVVTPAVNSITQVNGETYDTAHQSSEEVTELDPLTNQPIIFSRNHTHPPLPAPRQTNKCPAQSNSTDFPWTYEDLTKEILAQRPKAATKIDAVYSVLNEQLTEDSQSVPTRYTHKKSDYDQLTAVSLVPTVHPYTPLLSPPTPARSLPPETLAAVGLKIPLPQKAPIPAPRRSPSTPSTYLKESSPKLPSRLATQPEQASNTSANPIKKTFSPGFPLLPPTASISAPSQHNAFASPDSLRRTQTASSPIKTVPNPLYIPCESLDLIRSNSSYMPMRPTPIVPLVVSDREEHMESNSSSEDDGMDALEPLPPTNLIASLPIDPNLASPPCKRFNTEVNMTRQYGSAKLTPKFNSSSHLMGSPKETETAAVPVSTLEGWLFKQGGLRANKGWQRRWVLFDGYELKYFKSETSKDCQGQIPLGTMKEIQSGADSQNKSTDANGGVLGKQTRFVLVTLNRSYYFHAPNETEFKRWVNTLQGAICQYKPCSENSAEGGTMNEPDKTGILLKQGHNLSKDWRTRFCAIKDTRLCYYYTEDDFKMGNPINTINMRLAAVKPKPGPEGQSRFEIIIAGGRNYVFGCRTLPELQEWIDALQLSVLQSLSLFDLGQNKKGSAQDILTALYTNPGNMECADCKAVNPSWVSLNLCVLVCIECSGVHRAMGAHISKIRSADLDQTAWTPVLIELLICLGNDEINRLYLDKYHGEKLACDEQTDIRQTFINAKYKDKAWLKKGIKSSLTDNPIDEQIEINSALCEASLNGTLSETMHLILQGANPTYCDPIPRIPGQPACTPLQLAKAMERPLHHELLFQWKNDVDRDQFTGTIERSHLSGYLYKYSPATIKGHVRPQLRPIWQKRFFVLTQEGISILKSDRDLDPEGEILSSDILQVQESKDLPDHQETTKFPHVFELITSKPAIYAFAAPTNPEMAQWIRKISSVMNPDVFQLHGFDQWGYLEMRTGLTAAWKRRFCYLKSRVLVMLCLDKAEPEMIQLQSCLSIQPPTDPEAPVPRELTVCFQIITHDKTFSFKSESHEDAKLWYQVLKRTQVFGVPLLEQQYTRAGVPLLIYKCIEFIEDNGMEEIGLYRISGRSKQIDDLTLQFDQDCRALVINPEVFTVHDVAGVLKRFFRALPGPLLTRELYSKFLIVSDLKAHDDKMYGLHELVKSLPKENRDTLLTLCEHLNKVSLLEETNKMGTHNLAILFGPNIRGSDLTVSSSTHPIDEKTLLGETEKESKLMHCLIDHFAWLFDVKKDTDQKKKVEEAMVKMKEAIENEKKKTWSRVESNEFLITIFIDDKHGETITLKASIITLARQAFDQCVCKKGLTMDNLTLYEILGNNECERVVNPEERILMVVSSWSNKNNYLCIKINSLVRRICDFQAVRGARVSLYMKDRTRWKKFFFWVNGEWLFWQREGKGLFKDGPQTTKLDFVLFIGLLQSDISKNPPTKWGFWLQGCYDTHRYLCADTEQEMYRFIACFLHARYPNGAHSLTYSLACDKSSAGNLSPRREYPEQSRSSKQFMDRSLHTSEIC